jgi:hypothetical protein
MHLTNTPLKAAIFVSFVCIWFSLILLATFGKVIVNEDLYVNMVFLGCAVTILIGLLIIRGGFVTQIVYKSGMAPWVTTLGLIAAVPITIIYPVAKGVPTAMHFVSSATEGEMTITVLKKRDLYNSKGCKGAIHTVEFQAFGNHFVCGFGKEYWSNLTSGDKINLIGEKSNYGFKYNDYKS